MNVECAAGLFDVADQMRRLSGERDFGIGFEPEIFDVRQDLAYALADLKVQAGLLLIGGVDFQMEIVDGLAVGVVDHLDDAGAFIEGIEEVVIVLLALTELFLGLPGFGDVSADDDRAYDAAVVVADGSVVVAAEPGNTQIFAAEAALDIGSYLSAQSTGDGPVFKRDRFPAEQTDFKDVGVVDETFKAIGLGPELVKGGECVVGVV